ncbi:MAG: DUF1592 domain-containing protein [Verrucomicrobiota bacterium]
MILSAVNSAAFDKVAFVENYCVSCHGADKQKADRRFDDLPLTATSHDDLERWQEVIDVISLEDMPPEDEPQPSESERAEMIESATEFVADEATRLIDSGGHSILRRLNSWEYRQTIGDLLSLDVEAWNPAADFPAEVTVHGFDNNGAGLVTSGMLLDHYLHAAEEIIHRATYFSEKPKSEKYSQASPFYFNDSEHAELPKLFQVDRFRFIPETPYTDLYGRHYRGGHIGFVPMTGDGAPHSGHYTVRVKAAAVDRVHPYGDIFGDFQNGDPLVLELMAVDRRGSVESEGNVTHETSLAVVELTSEEPEWLEWEVYLEKGFEPEVRFRNGTISAKRLTRILASKAAERSEVAKYANMSKSGLERWHGLLRSYEGPKLRVWEIQVEGPHVDEWPPASHQMLYGDLKQDELSLENISVRLSRFAEEAFRRPLEENEILPIEALVMAKLDEGMEPLDALQLGFQTILCSPGFLYLNEGDGPLSNIALASRLSYFLWSSAPDTELLSFAREGKLAEPQVLSEQVERLLEDPRSDRFVSNFIRLWLDLDNIGDMPVSEDFRDYYRDNLGTAMRGETEMFFRHILDQNLPPSEFLNANYSFLNRELARHYGIDGIEGSQLQRVSLEGTSRGGLTGQGLFLTASANGVDTSPVVRGIYVLEKVLGYSPPPPPPDVPVIESDTSGAVTIRDQLAKHRSVASCAECHRKIDPMGFALENFDAIGKWRTEYRQGVRIDSSGSFPGGDSFESVTEFQRLIAGQEEAFIRCLAEKLLIYALGRELEFGDREVIDGILSSLEEGDGGFRVMIHAVAKSGSFFRN